ncbi:MAG: NUDIX hydrolase [Bacteroidales bacterium]|nr:NUDIX hydrolase [Bacteroidales bacterium]MCF8344985.1 NUDIX hydrolase [Bacteroidales bacterium]MCF8350458.1 NUDIX hydrolase [Bacteroidales bacterium]MCF8376207.1 NUDIX hydrolase [Bacteroidales bacterium]MCF8401127.1 NUDIX hydrolase [Bacteroidales bacterium]
MSYTYDYPRPAVTVDAVVFRKTVESWNVLLIRRGNPPFEGQWALPGGFLEMDEELEDAALRELEEETGLKANGLVQLHAFGKIGRDPRGRTIGVTYLGFAGDEGEQVKGGDDAAMARWFPIDELPALAFDHQDVISLAKHKIHS